jgi:3-hydroxyisobutyrate dehydrogenase-like beta-hydroxyacid dehydrogenase
VWNRTPAKTGPLVARGARAVDRITDLGGCDIVFVTVSASRDLEEVVAELLSGESRPGMIVDCSTVSAAGSARVRALAEAAGVGLLAAPVSGNPNVVAEGGACIVASGPVEVFERARPYLDAMTRVAVYAGAGEQSRLVKLCHNLYLGMMVEALVEVVTLAEKGGTSRAAFLEFFNSSALTSDWIRRRSPELARRDWTLTFTNELLRKDFDLGLGEARQLEVPMPAGSTVYQLIQAAIGHGLRNEDFLSLYGMRARAAGLP